MPTPPEVPVSYLGTLAARVAAPGLSYEEQTALVMDVKESLRDPASVNDSRILLQKLKQRHDLLAKTEREIDELLRSVTTIESQSKVSTTKVLGAVAGVLVIALIASLVYYSKQNLDTAADSGQPAEEPVETVHIKSPIQLTGHIVVSNDREWFSFSNGNQISYYAIGTPDSRALCVREPSE